MLRKFSDLLFRHHQRRQTLKIRCHESMKNQTLNGDRCPKLVGHNYYFFISFTMYVNIKMQMAIAP